MAPFTGTPVSASGYLMKGVAGGRMPAQAPIYGNYLREHGSWIHTATQGSGTGEVNMFTLPPGRIQIFPSLSRIITTAYATSSTLDIGHRAYTNLAGTSVAADADEWLDGADSTSALDQVLTAALIADYTEYNSQAGIIVYATVLAGNIEAADLLDLWITYKFVETIY